VSSRKVTNFRLAPELPDALHYIKERDGIPVVEQARRALLEWVEERGVAIESNADRLRALTRKRP
jgi:hypothetical protein